MGLTSTSMSLFYIMTLTAAAIILLIYLGIMATKVMRQLQQSRMKGAAIEPTAGEADAATATPTVTTRDVARNEIRHGATHCHGHVRMLDQEDEAAPGQF